jgi:transposase
MRTKSELLELRDRAIALRRAGKSRREIKEILGVGNSTLDPALRGEPAPLWTLRARAKDELHAKARELRASGRTYDEIADELGVSKGSISLWVRDIPRRGRLSYEEFRKRNAAGVARYWESERPVREARREQIRDTAAAQIRELSDREVIIAGAIAYWCEGSKSKPYRRSEQLDFINSDPQLISFFLRFLTVAGVSRDRLVCRLHIHESADVTAAQQFWLDLTGLPAEQFRRPTLKRHNPKTVRKNTGESYHGCLIIKVRRSAKLYRQVEGWAFAAMALRSKDENSEHNACSELPGEDSNLG